MSITFISNGEADDAMVKQSIIDQQEFVLFKNRFGREVAASRYTANKKVRRGEGEIIADPAPEFADQSSLREKYKELYGKKPFGAWSAKVLQEKIAEKSS